MGTENLLGFTQYYDPSYPHYLAHLPTLDPRPQHSICVDRVGPYEDSTMGACLAGVGIRPGNTMDHHLRERFLPFRDTDHAQMVHERDDWYWIHRPEGVAEGEDCCSPYLIAIHNYKSGEDAEKYWPILAEKYNTPKNWDEIMLPPRPRQVLYSRTIDFEVDQWLNIKHPPRGQRIYKGAGKEWICHDCDVGSVDDPWWTEWWDDVEAHFEIGFNLRSNNRIPYFGSRRVRERAKQPVVDVNPLDLTVAGSAVDDDVYNEGQANDDQ